MEGGADRQRYGWIEGGMDGGMNGAMESRTDG